MQLHYFLAVLISLSFGSLPDSSQSFPKAVAFSLAVIMVWWCLCILSARMVIRLIDDGEIHVGIGDRWFYRQSRSLRWFSIALVFLCLGGFGLGRNLGAIPLVQHSLVLQSLILLTPAIALMFGIWCAEYLFEARVVSNQVKLRDAASWALSEFRSGIGWLLIPILGCMAIFDLSSIATKLSDSTAVLPSWVPWTVVAVAGVSAIPLLVRKVFPTKTLSKEDSDWISDIIQSSGLPKCRVAIWNTNNRYFNAMIAGLLGRFRILILSDRLFNELPRDQLSMVILHEVAHAKRFHVPVRIAALGPAWLLALAMSWFIDHVPTAGATHEWLHSWSGTMGSLFGVLSTVLILRVVSHRIEYDADAVACKLAPIIAPQCDEVPETIDRARMELAKALLHVTEESVAARKSSWLHPGIFERIDAIGGLESRIVTRETSERRRETDQTP